MNVIKDTVICMHVTWQPTVWNRLRDVITGLRIQLIPLVSGEQAPRKE